jgi:hypothetical protein
MSDERVERRLTAILAGDEVRYSQLMGAGKVAPGGTAVCLEGHKSRGLEGINTSTKAPSHEKSFREEKR